ncbi:NAD-binding protein [Candidatus Igneacidithiobacillus taiwanensis]|uniref:NAD-binding protein n=1 Tax=Candidatus Igneacidithiobacillus taiwanensis TaxID=1945924 RepID=UPI00289A46D4|nr:NAD-binding protein [Candidatus Igneacidithiobacillus taiwanensis]MCE5360146.1 NAD-binding protein [Acidithiobacillus sp.]
MSLQNHYVIVGDTPLARNSYREFKQRGQTVRVILLRQPDDTYFQAEDVIIGDASDTDVLNEAQVGAAAAVLALRADDSENAFIVLAVRELQGPAKTVAAVNDSKNLKRVQRVKPDMIIAPQVIGGEVLAMALSGEELSSDAILQMFHSSNRA